MNILKIRMNKNCFYIICIVLMICVGCTSKNQEQQQEQEQIVQKPIVEDNKPVMLKVLERVKKEPPSIADFFCISEIANAIKDKYGDDYYSFLLQQTNEYTNIHSNIEIHNNFFGEAQMYFLTFNFETKFSGNIQFQYHINEDIIDVCIAVNGIDNYSFLVNPDGTFALQRGDAWELKYLEYDEFEDPIKDKVFIAVYNGDIINSTYIAVMKGDENHVRFYYDLPWYPDTFDNNEIISIKIKNKDDGTVRKLSNYKYNTKYCILSEEDSRYIRELCDSSSQISFCIRFEVISYNHFPDYDKPKVCTIDFDNGKAYGLNNAIMSYFYRVF